MKLQFKKHYANHKKSPNLIKSKYDTILFIEYWNLKQKQQAPRIKLVNYGKLKDSIRLITPLLQNVALA